MFESACDKDPSAIALECGDEQLTYRELDERANRLAHHLRSFGVVGGARVAILLQRSVDTYVALLGVGKAGAAFVPINPESPATTCSTDRHAPEPGLRSTTRYAIWCASTRAETRCPPPRSSTPSRYARATP
ncbi:AMP-binding protein [Micromonospora cremea]|uniref:AMP-binding enzyme n=1 Tax=Micromonospora cremea TaxID=709881 RepID=A0A1N5TXQ7_9ACTN|nr:AMP-binding protein [Micromonospora cremea]SIM52778.1 AMP-binding enzyme [Micromonospora cremea]